MVFYFLQKPAIFTISFVHGSIGVAIALTNNKEAYLLSEKQIEPFPNIKHPIFPFKNNTPFPISWFRLHSWVMEFEPNKLHRKLWARYVLGRQKVHLCGIAIAFSYRYGVV